jgi:superoxide reductase
MKRRDLFKKLGAATAGLLSVGVLLNAKHTAAQDKRQEKLIINRQHMSFADPKNPTDHELKHTPDISFHDQDAKGFTKIVITIGQKGIIHPTEENHWIDYMMIYQNDLLVSNMVFENGPIRGYGEHYINLKKGDHIKVEAGCNLHGIWENSATFL